MLPETLAVKHVFTPVLHIFTGNTVSGHTATEGLLHEDTTGENIPAIKSFMRAS